MRERWQTRRGSVLMLSYLMAASTLLVLAQVFATRSLSENTIVQRFTFHQDALLSAESGLEEAIGQLTSNTAYPGTDTEGNGCDVGAGWQPLGTGALTQDFCTTVGPAVNGRQQVISRGRMRNSSGAAASTRTITAFVERAEPTPFDFALFAVATTPYTLNLTDGGKTDSYNSAPAMDGTNPATFRANGHIGTNSITSTIADHAIYVHAGAIVNGDALVGPTDAATRVNAIKTDTGGAITGNRASLAAPRNFALPTIPYPFTPTPSAVNAPGSDSNDWKNVFFPTTNPNNWPAIAWKNEIPVPGTGGTIKPVDGLGNLKITATPTNWSECNIRVLGRLLIMPAGTLNLSCPGGASLYVKGALTVLGDLTGVKTLRVDHAAAGDPPITMNVGATVTFTGINPTLYLLGSQSLDIVGSVTGLQYLYAHGSVGVHNGGAGTGTLHFTNTYAIGTVTGSAGGTTITGSGTSWTSVGGLTTGSQIMVNSNVYTVLSVVSDTQLTISGTIASAFTASNYTVSLNNMGLLYSDGTVGVGGNHSNSITKINRLYAGVSAGAANVDLSNHTGNPHIDFVGTTPTLYAKVSAGAGRRGRINGIERIYAASTGALGASIGVDDGTPLNDCGGTINFSTAAGAHPLLYGEGRVYLDGGGVINGVERLFSGDNTFLNSFTNIYCSTHHLSEINFTGTEATRLFSNADVSNGGFVTQLHRLFATGNVQTGNISFIGTSARLFLEGTLDVNFGLVTHASNRPTDLLIASRNNGGLASVTIRNSATRVNAAIYAPGAPLHIKDDARLFGAGIALTADMTDLASPANTRVHYDESLADQSFDFGDPGVRVLAVREN